MEAYYSDEAVTLYHGDCFDVIRSLPDCSVDAVVTDPPYNLSFMGKSWMRCVAVEMEADYLPIIVARLSKPIQMGLL